MSLFEIMQESCQMLTQEVIPDGAGGKYTEWQAGDTFNAAITYMTTAENPLAEAQRVENRYTVTTPDIVLKHQDVFKRLSDGQIFRITSDYDPTTPDCATFYFTQREAEKWELPSDEEVSGII